MPGLIELNVSGFGALEFGVLNSISKLIPELIISNQGQSLIY